MKRFIAKNFTGIVLGSWWSNGLPSQKCVVGFHERTTTLGLRQGPSLYQIKAAVRNFGQWTKVWSINNTWSKTV